MISKRTLGEFVITELKEECQRLSEDTRIYKHKSKLLSAREVVNEEEKQEHRLQQHLEKMISEMKMPSMRASSLLAFLCMSIVTPVIMVICYGVMKENKNDEYDIFHTAVKAACFEASLDQSFIATVF